MVYSGSPEPSLITYIKGVDRKNKGFWGLFKESRQSLISRSKHGETLILKREPNNPEDKNAVQVINLSGKQLGYLSRFIASKIAPFMDKGFSIKAKVKPESVA